jgi:transposase
VQLKTILNQIEKYKGFVYDAIRWAEPGEELEIEIKARAGSRPRCSQCDRPCAGYDRQPPRRFEYVPLWAIQVFFVYAPRRVQCRNCGVRVERLPWTQGKHRMTDRYAWFLANWSKRLSWKEVAEVFRTSWDSVFRAVEMAVDWGLGHRDLEGVSAIGVDEISRQKGHRYMTLVYQIDSHRKRLLGVYEQRTEASLHAFFEEFGEVRSRALQFICSDMWKPYLNVIAERAGQALHILDRFHIMAHFGKALDDVRAQEARQLRADGYEPVLGKTRWLLLKRPGNLTDKQAVSLSELLKYNLSSVRAYLLKEDFQRFWTYQSPYWAGKFLDAWCTRTMRSRIEPMKKVARMLRNHRELLMNWFRAKGAFSSGVVEGFNNKAKVIARRAYGYRTFRAQRIALLHGLGDLPEPAFTHRFC